MKKETTIYDIAKELKISASTVSRGLRNSEEVKKRTATLIAKKAKEMGYRPNNFAANLRNKYTDAIGVIVPKLSSHFIASALAGMEDARADKAAAPNNALMVCNLIMFPTPLVFLLYRIVKAPRRQTR